MAPPRDFLERFMSAGYADTSLASAAYWTLKPYASISRLDRYPLAAFLELDPYILRETLSMAIGAPIRRFVGYSVIGVRSASVLGPSRNDRFHLDRDFPDGFRETLAEAALPWMPRQLAAPDATCCLLESGTELLESGLWPRIRRTLAGVPSRHVRAVARENLWRCLLHAWTSARRGDFEEFDRLRPLLGLMTKAIPVGELREDPGTWLVLTR